MSNLRTLIEKYSADHIRLLTLVRRLVKPVGENVEVKEREKLFEVSREAQELYSQLHHPSKATRPYYILNISSQEAEARHVSYTFSLYLTAQPHTLPWRSIQLLKIDVWTPELIESVTETKEGTEEK